MTSAPSTRRRRPWVWGLLALAVVAAVALWRVDAWRGGGSGTGSAASAEQVTAGLTVYPPGKRPKMPALEGQTLDGAAFDLADLRGHVIVINVWGSWCGPCRAETPDLVRVAQETSARGVRFVGIDTRDNRAAAKAFARTYGVPYPSVFDSDGRALLPFRGVILLSAVPSTVVIDQDGRVAARVVGPVTYATLSGLLDDLIGSQR